MAAKTVAALIERLADRVYAGLAVVLALAFMAAVLMGFANALARYGWGATYRGADEIQVYVMVAMTFLGAGVVAWQNRHLRLDVLINGAPYTLRRLVRWGEAVLALVVCGFMINLSWIYMQRLRGFGMTSDTAGVPLWIPHAALVAGFCLIALAYVLKGFRPPAPGKEAGEATLAGPAARAELHSPARSDESGDPGSKG